jgi:raffinose/stachyose/melibiose transport system permease protein
MSRLTSTVGPDEAVQAHPVTPARRARAGRRRAGRRALATAAVFLAPLLAFYGLYYLFAFGFLITTSREQTSLSFTDVIPVGWNNFRLVLTDPYFHRAVVNNLIFAGVSIGVALTLGFFLAVVLSSGIRARRFFYVVFLLPSLIPMSLFATVFGRMLETDHGAINQTLRNVGLGALAQDWLGNEKAAYAALFLLLTYMVGLPIMYYTSDLTTANTAVLESAQIDGAGTWQTFRLILFPMLRNAHRTVILSVLLGSFRWFDQVYFSTHGQPGGRTAITGTYLYDSTLGQDRVGYASAAAVIVLVLALGVSAIQVIVQRKTA